MNWITPEQNLKIYLKISFRKDNRTLYPFYVQQNLPREQTTYAVVDSFVLSFLFSIQDNHKAKKCAY